MGEGADNTFSHGEELIVQDSLNVFIDRKISDSDSDLILLT